jgi:Plant transposon protein
LESTVRSPVSREFKVGFTTPDAAGVMGDQKFTSALRQLRYRASSDSLVENRRLSKSLNARCLKRFCKAVVDSLKGEYLRLPSEEELCEIEAEYARLRFPGCTGCVDVASWFWDKCPVGWQGQYIGKEEKPCCRMEIVCDDFLYI